MPSYLSQSGRFTAVMVVAAAMLVSAALVAGQTPAPATPAAAPAQAINLFETRIRPLLAANCFACHSESAMAGLRVDSRAGLLRGGETGPAVVPGDPDKSVLLKEIGRAHV